MDTAGRFAKTILNGFESYFSDFQNITLAGQTYFQQAHGLVVYVAIVVRS